MLHGLNGISGRESSTISKEQKTLQRRPMAANVGQWRPIERHIERPIERSIGRPIGGPVTGVFSRRFNGLLLRHG